MQNWNGQIQRRFGVRRKKKYGFRLDAGRCASSHAGRVPHPLPIRAHPAACDSDECPSRASHLRSQRQSLFDNPFPWGRIFPRIVPASDSADNWGWPGHKFVEANWKAPLGFATAIRLPGSKNLSLKDVPLAVALSQQEEYFHAKFVPRLRSPAKYLGNIKKTPSGNFPPNDSTPS